MKFKYILIFYLLLSPTVSCQETKFTFDDGADTSGMEYVLLKVNLIVTMIDKLLQATGNNCLASVVKLLEIKPIAKHAEKMVSYSAYKLRLETLYNDTKSIIANLWKSLIISIMLPYSGLDKELEKLSKFLDQLEILLDPIATCLIQNDLFPKDWQEIFKNVIKTIEGIQRVAKKNRNRKLVYKSVSVMKNLIFTISTAKTWTQGANLIWKNIKGFFHSTASILEKESEKLFEKQLEKQTEKQLEKQLEKQTEKQLEKQLEKQTEKQLEKQLEKQASSWLKYIPCAGIFIGGWFAWDRIADDKKTTDGKRYGKAALEMASGVSSCFPGIGSYFSYGIDAGLAYDDVFNE